MPYKVYLSFVLYKSSFGYVTNLNEVLSMTKVSSGKKLNPVMANPFNALITKERRKSRKRYLFILFFLTSSLSFCSLF